MQTLQITFQWQINFAVILSLLAVFITLVRWLVESRQKKKKERIQAYEEVFEDACYILMFPYQQRRVETKNREYVNSDPKLEKAVRDYVGSHWMKNTWGGSRINLSDQIDMDAHFAFIKLVQDEARKYQDSLLAEQYDVDLYEQSPVYHLKNQEVTSRMNRVMSYVGRHLSLFSDDITRAWEDVTFKDPEEIQKEYEKALEVCDQYFRHNPRGFSDPFYDMLKSIRQEYRELARRRGSIIHTESIWKIRHLYWVISHPIRSFKKRREMKKIASSAAG
jgi:hypothetical protein